MEADYSVELGPSAPALELPWSDPEGRVHYVEMRGAAGMADRNLDNKIDNKLEETTDRIPEARQFPALRRLLVDVNAPESAWQTVKCDVWAERADAAANLYHAGFTHGSYVDIVLAGQAEALRGSLEAHQRLAQEMARRLDTEESGADESIETVAEIVVRRCYFHREASPEESDAGYCLTLYVTGYGASAEAAAECWGRALEISAQCLRTVQPREGSAEMGTQLK